MGSTILQLKQKIAAQTAKLCFSLFRSFAPLTLPRIPYLFLTFTVFVFFIPPTLLFTLQILADNNISPGAKSKEF